ncbi:CIC11C00000000529 [Sungouiella intermedia]|uniref:CIC11C00000000529 n=1 Tax=Sungouiella intermedia TaxID=45354 RepID=A0A1L0BWV2_9ASCO|nr:CIC11C00000000529 [[Candida] intermedia]
MCILSVSHFYGQIHIPSTLTDLYLRVPHQGPFYRLKLPFGIESVNLSFLAKRYPGTISISKYTNKKDVQWPPHLRLLETNSNDLVDRALLKLPPSVRFLRGTNIRD